VNHQDVIDAVADDVELNGVTVGQIRALRERLFWIGAEEDRAEMVREARLLLDLAPSGPVHAELGRVWTPDTPTPGDGTWTERHTHLNRAARRANHKGNRR
jgi:hypothetical protein